jgi:hypothetical protein
VAIFGRSPARSSPNSITRRLGVSRRHIEPRVNDLLGLLNTVYRRRLIMMLGADVRDAPSLFGGVAATRNATDDTGHSDFHSLCLRKRSGCRGMLDVITSGFV